MRQSRDAHLYCDARKPTKNLVNVEHFACNSLCIPDQQGARWSAQGIELSPRRWWPPSFLTDLCEGVGVPRVETVGCFLRCIAQKPNGVQSNQELLLGMAGPSACFTIQINERSESLRFTTDDRDHQGKSECTGTYK